MNLYEINTEIEKAIENLFLNTDEATGEVRQEDLDALEALKVAKDEKLEAIGCYIKNTKAEAEAIKAEEKALKERREALEKKEERLKEYVANALQGEKWASAKVAFSFRKSEAVVIPDIDLLDEDYLNEEITYKPDKRAIKDELKSGGEVRGAYLEEKQNLQIK